MASLLLLSGCVAGPDFRRPTGPSIKHYSEDPEKGVDATGGKEGQRLIAGRDVPQAWWDAFNVPVLATLVKRALRENASVGAMTAALRRADELERAQRASLLPTVDAGVAATKQNDSSRSAGSGFSAILSLAYIPDFWGGLSRSVEQAKAQTDYQRFQLEAAQLALSSAVVRSAIGISSLDRQIQAAENASTAAADELRIIRLRLSLGAVSADEVSLQEVEVANYRASAQSLRLEREIAQHQLSAYLGRAPEQADLPQIDFDAVALPAELPLILPSTLVDRRPDIRAAESNWHAQTAGLGVATALRLPAINIGSTLGIQSGGGLSLFGPGSAVWSLLTGLTQNAFDGGALLHRQRAQRAAMDQAGELWRDQVVVALQQVADVLARIKSDATTLHLTVEAESAARRSLAIASARYHAGSSPYLLLLRAQQDHSTAASALIRAREARLADSVLLYEALGGGSWQQESPAPKLTIVAR